MPEFDHAGGILRLVSSPMAAAPNPAHADASARAAGGTAAARWAEAMPPSMLLLSWHGRVGRAQWWLFGVALPLAILVIGGSLLQIAGHKSGSTWMAVLRLGAMLPLLAVTAKRWHDLDRRAWWVLLLAVPYLGWLWTGIACGLRRGTAGPNRFGAAPELADPVNTDR